MILTEQVWDVMKIANLEALSSVPSNALWLAPYAYSCSSSGNVGFSSIRAHIQVALIKYVNKLKCSPEK